MKKIIVALFLLYGTALVAQNVKRPETHNYLKGVEAFNNGNEAEAFEFFKKDIQENPENGYSYFYIAYLDTVDFEKALNAANMAIKYIPLEDVYFIVEAYRTRANIYLNIKDTANAIADYTAAIKVNPSFVDIYYAERAEIYYLQGKYDLAEADYRKIIDLKPNDHYGYFAVGSIAAEQKRYEEAIKQLNYAINLSKDNSVAYSYRAESYIGLEKWDEATNDIIRALEIDWKEMPWNKWAWNMANDMKEPALSMLLSKLKAQFAKCPKEPNWSLLIASLYHRNNQYKEAINWYNTTSEIKESPNLFLWISDCYKELGDYKEALNNINKALNMDGTNVSYLERKADICYEIGNVESAIAECDKILKMEPQNDWVYYRRGWYKALSGNFEGAIEDYTKSLTLDPQYSYAYASRGYAYRKLGKKDLADADFKKVIELEDSPEKYESIFYAYQGLGENDKAIEAINTIIATDTTDAVIYYEAACLYSRMEDKANALKYLEKSLELGYSNFAHIERDYDLDFIRSTDEFKALINKYKSLRQTQNSGVSNASIEKESVTSEVAFTKEDGICKVKCSINGLPLFFYFDTGAADVTISMVEATFMMKNGYLKEQDIVGSQRYMDANGNVSEGTVINLKTVDFGGLELENVKASVVRNQKAPLLLGQSVLGRLGKIEIDNQRQVLIIKAEK